MRADFTAQCVPAVCCCNRITAAGTGTRSGGRQGRRLGDERFAQRCGENRLWGTGETQGAGTPNEVGVGGFASLGRRQLSSMPT